MASHVRHGVQPSRLQQQRGRLRVRQSTSSNGSRATTRVYAAAEVGNQYVLSSGLVDYYEVLGVDDDAPTDEIKKAYRALAKECHPDYLGDRGHSICILLNEAYQVLSNPTMRTRYDAQLEEALADEDVGYTGQALSKWIPSVAPKMAKNANPKESRAVFVDEVSCIGCKNCVWCASATFRMEPEYGRSRVFAQWLDNEETLQTAIDSCPVSCIHWVQKEDLPALEFVMQHRVERINVGVMMAGQGNPPDVFDATAQFLRKRREAEEARKRSAKFSPQQEAARRKAAEELARQNLGFFAGLGDMLRGVQQSVQSIVDPTLGGRVGTRKRAQRWYDRDAVRSSRGVISGGGGGGGGEGYSVPPERALVPISVYARKSDI